MKSFKNRQIIVGLAGALMLGSMPHIFASHTTTKTSQELRAQVEKTFNTMLSGPLSQSDKLTDKLGLELARQAYNYLSTGDDTESEKFDINAANKEAQNDIVSLLKKISQQGNNINQNLTGWGPTNAIDLYIWALLLVSTYLTRTDFPSTVYPVLQKGNIITLGLKQTKTFLQLFNQKDNRYIIKDLLSTHMQAHVTAGKFDNIRLQMLAPLMGLPNFLKEKGLVFPR